jgi:hypothetical protein
MHTGLPFVEALQRDLLFEPSIRPEDRTEAVHDLHDLFQFLLVVTSALTLFGAILRLGKEFGAAIRACVTRLFSSMDPVFETRPTIAVFAGSRENTRWRQLVSTDDALNAVWILYKGGDVFDGNERTDPL